jgi:hypothetical protein
LDHDLNVARASRLISSGEPMASGFSSLDSLSRRWKRSSVFSCRGAVDGAPTVAIGFLSNSVDTTVYLICQ